MSNPKKTTLAQAAIDFGVSNTDAVALVEGKLRRWLQPYQGQPDLAQARQILQAGDVDLSTLDFLAVTGGRHRQLPPILDGCPVVGVGELESIGRGGQALAGLSETELETPLLVVSAGSGTAMVAARGRRYTHVTGTGVGGGTLLGLGRLLLNTTSPQEIDALALQGHANAVDLSLADVVAGPIGTLPPDATAVNFGRLARPGAMASRQDLAAALATMIGQVIATLAIVAARAQQIQRVVVIGHLTDIAAMRRQIAGVGDFYGFPLELPLDAGHATALGALLWAQAVTPYG